jgi:hypothetical protein
MHVIRAKANDVGKEVALRSFFSNKERLQDWKSVVTSIALIHEVNLNWQHSNEANILWEILQTYPNYYWNFPLIVYLHKHGQLINGEFQLSEEHTSNYTKLCKATFKYFFLKGIVHNSVNAVKDTAFKVCASIIHDDDFTTEYEKNIGEDYIEFIRKIENKQYGRYLNGLVLLSAYLNPEQDMADFKSMVKSNYHIEHILPKKWNNYDKWTQETWEANLNALGNLVPLEWNLNISAKNEFFTRKKEQYRKSKVSDALNLLTHDEWYPEQFKDRHEVTQNRVLIFFK